MRKVCRNEEGEFYTIPDLDKQTDRELENYFIGNQGSIPWDPETNG